LGIFYSLSNRFLGQTFIADLVNTSDAPPNRLKSGYDKVEGLAREFKNPEAEIEGRKRLGDLERTVIISPPSTPSEEAELVKFATTVSKFVDPARRLVKEYSLPVLNPGEQVVQSLVSPVLVLPGGFLPCVVCCSSCCRMAWHWKQQLDSGTNKIWGPRQVYVGEGERLTLDLKRDVTFKGWERYLTTCQVGGD